MKLVDMSMRNFYREVFIFALFPSLQSGYPMKLCCYKAWGDCMNSQNALSNMRLAVRGIYPVTLHWFLKD